MDERKRNIFIVDDEEPIRKVLNTHLTKEGFNVIQTQGGNGVFETLTQNTFDLVISDIRMPEVDGIRVLEFVKANFDTVPVVMLTGLTDISIAIDVMKKGAFDFLMKPVKKDELMAVVHKALLTRDLLERNKELEVENKEYQLFLEQKVRERTKELNSKAMELQRAYGVLKSMNIQFVNVLAETIEAKDRHTRGHCNRMRYLCVELGRQAGLSPEDLETLEYASLLHDLGKIGINEAVLNKEGPLTGDECTHIKAHTEIGEKILIGIPLMEQVAKIIVAHHENFDGTGYPRNLKGDDIPFCSRIIAVADIYDAMSSDRPYRKGLPLEAVIEEMRRVSGTQLDPELVGIFIEKKVYLFNKN
ncbi:MAG: response regulator [Deltaproteobacteria bacterium]|nr:response regulator [Deltaproteobacteria bacterium]